MDGERIVLKRMSQSAGGEGGVPLPRHFRRSCGSIQNICAARLNYPGNSGENPGFLMIIVSIQWYTGCRHQKQFDEYILGNMGIIFRKYLILDWVYDTI